MKQAIVITILILCASFCFALLDYVTGVGGQPTSTTTPTRVYFTNGTVTTLSVFNKGTNTVYIMANCETNNWVAKMVNTNAIPVSSSNSYTIVSTKARDIESFVHGTLNGDSDIDWAAK